MLNVLCCLDDVIRAVIDTSVYWKRNRTAITAVEWHRAHDRDTHYSCASRTRSSHVSVGLITL